MTEMNELAERMAATDHEDHEEESCAFCHSPTKPSNEKNILKPDFDQDQYEVPGLNDDGVAFKNSAVGCVPRTNQFPRYSSNPSPTTAIHHYHPSVASHT